MNRRLTDREATLSLAAWLAAVTLWLLFSPGILHLIDTLAMEAAR